MAQEDLPTLYGNGWTYNGGGTFTAESGDVQVTYNEAKDNFDFTFEPTEIKKLDYTYRYGVTLHVVALKPLNAGFDGEVKIVLAAIDSVAKPAPIAAPAGLRVWFTDTSLGLTPNEPVGENGNDDTIPITGIYKAETDRNGKFSVVGLPANTEFTVTVNYFTHTVAKDTFYFDGTGAGKLHALNEENLATSTTYGPVTTLANGALTLKPIVLFAEKELVFVSAYKAGTLAEPLPVQDTTVVDAQGKSTTTKAEIEVTFTEAMDPSSFSATLLDSSTTARGYGSVRLKASAWSKDNKTVTLVAEEHPAVLYGKITLPFNEFVGVGYVDQDPTGTLSLRGKKADGTQAFVAAAVPVYTEEKIKLLSAEVLDPLDPQAERPTRSLFTVKLGGAVKLTFSKPIATDNVNTHFTFATVGTKEIPDYKIDGAVVYVYIDQKIPLTAATQIEYWVVSSVHSDDVLGSIIGGVGTLTPDSFTTDGLQQLVVNGTNLYDPNPVVSLTAGGVQNGASYFPITRPIEITFTREIIDGTAEVELFLGDPDLTHDKITNKVPLAEGAVVVEGKTVTITHDPLEPDHVYYMSLNVFDVAGDLIYTTEGLDTATLLLAIDATTPDFIWFTTAHKKLVLTGTNLYDSRYYNNETSYLTVTPYLPLNGSIELTFDEEIPLTSPKTGLDYIVVALDDSDPMGVSTIPLRPVELINNGKTLKITPIRPLAGGTDHYLSVQIQFGSQDLFSTGVGNDDYWEYNNGKHVAVRSDPGEFIQFMPENKLSVRDTDLLVPLPGDEDIFITFNKLITLDTTHTKLYFTDAAGDSHAIPTADVDITLEDGKTVRVSPKHTLAVTNSPEQFELALYVTSNEDYDTEQWVADDHWEDNKDVVHPYADIQPSITFEVTSTVESYTGPVLSSQKDVVALGTVTNLSSEIRNDEYIDLSWDIDYTKEVAGYTVWHKWQNALAWTNANAEVLPSASDKYVARVEVPQRAVPIVPVDYMVTGKNEYGFVKQGRLDSLTVLGDRLAISEDTGGNPQVDDSDGSLEWTLLSTNTDFFADQSIVLVFNKNVTGADGKFFYNDGGTLRDSAATFTPVGKTVTVTPAHQLMVSENYEFSLKVTAADGDIVEYNAAAVAEANDYPTVLYNINFATDAALSGGSILPIDLGIIAVNFDTNADITAPVPWNITAVGLKWDVTTDIVDLLTEYTIENRYSNTASTNWDEPVKTRAGSGASVLYRLSSGPLGTLGTDRDLATLRDPDQRIVVYRVSATNKQGFLVGGATQITVKAPKLAPAGAGLAFSHGSKSTTGTLIPHAITALDPDENIIFEFNKPVTVTTDTKLFLNQSGEFSQLTEGTDYTITAGPVSVGGNPVVIITPSFLLAPSQTFSLKLHVRAADGDQWASDASLYPPINTPEITQTAEDIVIQTAAIAAFGTTPLSLDGYTKLPRSASLSLVGGGTGTGMANNTATLTLQLSRPAVPINITQNYYLYERSTLPIPAGTVVQILTGTYNNVLAAPNTALPAIPGGTGVSGSVLATEAHSATRNLVYIFECVDGKGFLVKESKNITFLNP
jgi:hypothetical protein